MRILGLDLGSRTIGIAISDELGLTAQGLKTIRRKSPEEDLRELAIIISQYKIQEVVVGLPRNMDGSLGTQAEKVLQWAESFRKRTNVPVTTGRTSFHG